MLGAVDNTSHWSLMLAQKSLFAALKVYPGFINQNWGSRSVTSRWWWYLLTPQSMPAVNASLSSAPKQTSSTGARCSYVFVRFVSPGPLAIS